MIFLSDTSQGETGGDRNVKMSFQLYHKETQEFKDFSVEKRTVTV